MASMLTILEGSTFCLSDERGDIVERGPAWFSSFGRNGRKGLRSYSVSGRVREPGVKLAPAGISLRELVDEFCGGMLPGHELYAYLPGGASGGILPARLADVPLDFDTLQPHGCFIGSAAVIVLSDKDRARDLEWERDDCRADLGDEGDDEEDGGSGVGDGAAGRRRGARQTHERGGAAHPRRAARTRRGRALRVTRGLTCPCG